MGASSVLIVPLDTNYLSKAHPLDRLPPFRSTEWGMYFITRNPERCSGYIQIRSEHGYAHFLKPGCFASLAFSLSEHRPQARRAWLNSHGRRRAAKILKAKLGPAYLCSKAESRQGRLWPVRIILKHISIPKYTSLCADFKPGLYLTVCRFLWIMFSRCFRLTLRTILSPVDFELEAVPMPVLLKSNR